MTRLLLSAVAAVALATAATAADPMLYELRIYTAEKGKLDALNARFRDHTLKLFEKHGMTNVAYFTYAKGLNKTGDDTMLVYLLAHPSEEAAMKAFAEFGKDSAWVAAKKASEDKAGGSLTEKDGVKRLFLKATDYSPTK